MNKEDLRAHLKEVAPEMLGFLDDMRDVFGGVKLKWVKTQEVEHGREPSGYAVGFADLVLESRETGPKRKNPRRR